MTYDTIVNNFLNVGNSRSFDPTYSPKNYSSLARFGIGFWSVFTISAKCIIETAPFEYNKENINQKVDGLSFEVSIDELKDYAVFTGKKMNTGTKITLMLKDDINLDEIMSRIEFEIACSEIPIEIKNENDSFFLPARPRIPTLQEIFGPKFKLAQELNIELFKWQIQNELDFQMYLFYRKTFRITFLVDSNNGLSALKDTLMNVRHNEFSICGFSVGLNISTVIDIWRIGGFKVNTNNPKGFIYALNRKSLIENMRYTEVKEKTKNYLHHAYRTFLEQTGSYNNANIFHLNLESRSNGGNVFGYYTSSLLYNAFKAYPDLVCFRLIKLERGKQLFESESKYFNINEILKTDFKVWTYGSYNFRYIKINSEDTALIHQLLLQIPFIKEGDYLHEGCIEASMLFDNCEKSKIVIFELRLNKDLSIKLPLIEIFTKNIIPAEKHNNIIGRLQGTWSGHIYEKEIEGGNYAILGQSRFVMKKDSQLAEDIKKMYNDGLHHKICELIRKLEQAFEGFIDDSVEKYL